MKKLMKRLICLLLALLSGLGAQAQTTNERVGIGYYDAIPVSFPIGKHTFTDTRDTSKSPPYYSFYSYIPRNGTSIRVTGGNAVYYQVEIAAKGNLIIHNWSSPEVAFTTLFLLRPIQPGETSDWLSPPDLPLMKVASFEECDFNAPGFDPEKLGMPEGSSWGQAYLHVKNLPAGTYYVVAAGYKYSNGSTPNGKLRTTLIADLLPGIPAEPAAKPEYPNDSPVQYSYDESGNRTETHKKQP